MNDRLRAPQRPVERKTPPKAREKTQTPACNGLQGLCKEVLCGPGVVAPLVCQEGADGPA